MQRLNRNIVESRTYPERILQIGEGNFLRAFVDWMVHRMNRNTAVDYNSGVTIIQPIDRGLIDTLNEQDGLFTVRLTAMKDGKPSVTYDVVDCVGNAINPYSSYSDFISCAFNPDLKLIVSNTTEAGIAFDEKDKFDDEPPSSYPGKLTVFLFKRFEHFKGDAEKGLVVLPVELIENNASTLEEIILRYARLWDLGASFMGWVDAHCVFCNTLVDRIVTGYPSENIDAIQNELGYEDQLVVEGEQFHLWAIDDHPRAREVFPADQAGLNVVYTDDLPYYRRRKVRILNGAHTSMTVIGLTAGIETVRSAIEHEVMGRFLEKMVYREIVPTLGDSDELRDYAGEIINRFRNPFIKHFLSAISLNSVSKYKARILPTVLDHQQTHGELPQGLVLAMAALIRLYKGQLRGAEVELRDDPEVIEAIQDAWKGANNNPESVVRAVLSNEDFWGQDLNLVPDYTALVTQFLEQIMDEDPTSGLMNILKNY